MLSAGTAWAQLATLHTVDTGGVGQYTSVAYGTDGLPVISYYDVGNGDLRIAHCLDVACAASTKGTIDSAGDVGRHTSIAIGADGFPVVAYLDGTNARLKVAHCADAACTSWRLSTLAGVGPAANETAIAIPPDGRPLVAFGTGGTVLRIARCVDVACTDATATSHTGGGHDATLTIGGDGLALFAHGQGNGGILVRHCRDADCALTDSVLVSAPPPEGGTDGATPIFVSYHPALATHPDGRARMAWAVETITPPGSYFNVNWARCIDSACSALDHEGSLPAGGTAIDPVVAVGVNDRPVIAYTRFLSAYMLAVAPCSVASCTGVLPQTVGTTGQGRFPSAAVSPAGRGLIAHYDEASGSLMTAYLDGAGTADIGPTVVDNPDPVSPTGLLTYAISTVNAGPDVARGVTATVALPAGVTFVAQSSSTSCTYDVPSHAATCTGPDVAAGSTASSAHVVGQIPLGGLPSPIAATVTLGSSSSDPNPGNNSQVVTTGTTHGIDITPPPEVHEGDAGLTPTVFEVRLLENQAPPAAPVTVAFSTLSNTATSGEDFQPVSGSLTLTSAAPVQAVAVNVIGDVSPESHEDFRLYLQNAQGAAIPRPIEFAAIRDDDVRGQLGHGSLIVTDLRSQVPGPNPPAHTFWFTSPARASYEVVVDEVSGDLQPIVLERIDFFDGFVFQSATPTLGSVSMRWEHWWWPDIGGQGFRVRSGGCTTACGPDDRYRIRVYETTARIARFNNGAAQTTLLLLQNPSNEPVGGHVLAWNPQGAIVGGELGFTLPARASLLLDTATLAPNQAGSLTVTHDAPYGVLQGKAVALEPATGFSFDSPLEYRPR